MFKYRSFKVQTVQELEQFLREHHFFSLFNLDRVGVFGSFARGEKFNDIDILVEIPMPKNHQEAMRAFFFNRLKQKVDLVHKNEANPVILKHALTEIQYVTRGQA